MAKVSTRERIVAEADELFYRKGFERTSFSDIAEAVNISRGNFYYHFKTKDDILDAVIQARLGKTQVMLDQWHARGDSPRARIRSFIHILIANRTRIMQHGCPVGTLCSELAKLDHPSRAEANRLFTLFRDWLRHQFSQLGCSRNSDRFALHVLAWSQGVATLANAFHDERFIREEVAHLEQWLENCAEAA